MNTRTIKKMLQKDNPVVLEIGASCGGDTLKFLKEFPNIQLYCFEPDPRCIEIHRKRIKDERCKLYEIAISDLDGQVEFYQSGGQKPNINLSHDWLASSSIKKPKEHLNKCSWCTFENKIAVQTCRLDTWAKENEIEEIDFIWADVQGAEENLIKGGFKTLSHTKYFYTEFDNDEMYEGQLNLNQIKALLPSFKDIEYYQNNVLFKNTELPKSMFESTEKILTNCELVLKKMFLKLKVHVKNAKNSVPFRLSRSRGD